MPGATAAPTLRVALITSLAARRFLSAGAPAEPLSLVTPGSRAGFSLVAKLVAKTALPSRNQGVALLKPLSVQVGPVAAVHWVVLGGWMLAATPGKPDELRPVARMMKVTLPPGATVAVQGAAVTAAPLMSRNVSPAAPEGEWQLVQVELPKIWPGSADAALAQPRPRPSSRPQRRLNKI